MGRLGHRATFPRHQCSEDAFVETFPDLIYNCSPSPAHHSLSLTLSVPSLTCHLLTYFYSNTPTGTRVVSVSLVLSHGFPTNGPQQALSNSSVDGILLNHSSKVTRLLHAGLDSNLDTVVSDSIACMTELTRDDSLPSD